MVIPELDTKRAKRLRLACLLVQIALVEWVLQTLVWRTDAVWRDSAPSGVLWWIQNLAFVSSVARWLLLIVAVWMLSRGLSMWRSQIGAMLIFNVLLITLVKNLLMAVNWVWQLAGNEAKLVQNDPLADYFSWIGWWLWVGIWLLMIYGGVKIARDINAQFNGALLSSRRISVVYWIAIGAWLAYSFEIRWLGSVVRHWFPRMDESNYVEYQIVVTLMRIAVSAPALVFCVMLLSLLRRVRKILRSPTLRVCPKCSHTLHDSNAGRCPECGWTADSARDAESNCA